jgi:hypothetical protein
MANVMLKISNKILSDNTLLLDLMCHRLSQILILKNLQMQNLYFTHFWVAWKGDAKIIQKTVRDR